MTATLTYHTGIIKKNGDKSFSLDFELQRFCPLRSSFCSHKAHPLRADVVINQARFLSVSLTGTPKATQAKAEHQGPRCIRCEPTTMS